MVPAIAAIASCSPGSRKQLPGIAVRLASSAYRKGIDWMQFRMGEMLGIKTKKADYRHCLAVQRWWWTGVLVLMAEEKRQRLQNVVARSMIVDSTPPVCAKPLNGFSRRELQADRPIVLTPLFLQCYPCFLIGNEQEI